jgi:hypothetical protein
LLNKIIIDYLKSKPSNKYSLSDLVQVDLGRWTMININFLSSLILQRKLFGLLGLTILNEISMFMSQTLFCSFMGCCICFHLIQVSYACECLTILNNDEWLIVTIARIVTLVIGFSSSSVVCYFKGGFCNEKFFTNEHADIEDGPVHPVFIISILIFLTIMLVCQMLLEIKQRELRFLEQEASRIAQTASLNIKAAKDRFQMDNIRNPDVRHVWTIDVDTKEDFPVGSTNENLSDARHLGFAISRLFVKSFLLFVAILVLSVFVQKVDHNRPHGSVLIFLTVWGIIIPIIIILRNKKIQNFVSDRMLKFGFSITF